MALDTMSEKIESSADLADFIDTQAVMKNVATNGTDIRTEVIAQIELAGVEATDEAIDDLVAELEQEVSA